MKLARHLLVCVSGNGPFGGAQVIIEDGTELACRDIEIECTAERGAEVTVTMRCRTVGREEVQRLTEAREQLDNLEHEILSKELLRRAADDPSAARALTVGLRGEE